MELKKIHVWERVEIRDPVSCLWSVSVSDGLERTPFLSKETWTALRLAEAGNVFLTSVLAYFLPVKGRWSFQSKPIKALSSS